MVDFDDEERVSIEANGFRFRTAERIDSLLRELEARGVRIDPVSGEVTFRKDGKDVEPL